MNRPESIERLEFTTATGDELVDMRHALLTRTMGELAVDLFDPEVSDDPQALGVYFDYLKSLLERPPYPVDGAQSRRPNDDAQRSQLDLLTLVGDGLSSTAICELMRLTADEYLAMYDDLVRTLGVNHAATQAARSIRKNAGIDMAVVTAPVEATLPGIEAPGLIPKKQRKAAALEYRLPLLRAEQEVDLAMQIEAGVLAQERLDNAEAGNGLDSVYREELETLVVQGKEAFFTFRDSNLRLVELIINRNTATVAQSGITDREQLRSVMIETGLEHAIEMFDFTRGIKFSTYAVWWIKHGLMMGIVNQLPMKISRQAYVTARHVYAFEQAFTVDNHRPPTNNEILEAFAGNARVSETTLPHYQAVFARIGEQRSLNRVVYDSNGSPMQLAEIVSDRSVTPFADQIAETMTLNKVLDELNPEERTCIGMFFGFNGRPAMSNAALARELEMKPWKTSKILQKAIQKMKVKLVDN